MAEYIEREALVDELAKGTIISDDIYGIGIMTGVGRALTVAKALPAADVVEVKHGRWTENERIMYDSVREEEVHLFTYVCSVCNGEVMNNTKYCPNCGARMDGA